MKDTKYEKARMLGARALQISMGAPFLVKLTKKEMEDMHYNPIEIAKKEYAAGVIPIAIIRRLPKLEENEGDNKGEAS